MPFKNKQSTLNYFRSHLLIVQSFACFANKNYTIKMSFTMGMVELVHAAHYNI